MRFLNDYWGLNENITPLEIAARAAAMFIITLILLRVYGMKPFGKENSFDTIITFFIGGILVRGIIGATPFFSTIAAAIVILLVHKIIAKLSFYSKFFGYLTKGENRVLFEHGRFCDANMQSEDVTEHDIREALRDTMQIDSLDKVEKVYLERTGRLSFIKKPE
jgi:uncharacterized membrane protein YcaP (DUF421 family)